MSSRVPLAEKSFFAAADPSVGTIQICFSLTNATRAPEGESAGSSPSASIFGSQAVVHVTGTLQIWILGATGLDSGLGGGPSQFAECSPPRTYTTYLPSPESETLVSSWPSS